MLRVFKKKIVQVLMHLPYCYFNLFGDGTVVLVCLEYLKNSDIMPNLKKKRKIRKDFPIF